MKQYLLNKLNKISRNLNKKYIEPISILFVYENTSKIITTLTFSNSQPNEKYCFESKVELEHYIQEKNIKNIITGVCFDKI